MIPGADNRSICVELQMGTYPPYSVDGGWGTPSKTASTIWRIWKILGPLMIWNDMIWYGR